MKITKLGHCCLLIEDKGLRILTDPGSYSTAQNDLKNIDAILITHEHGDHLHVESLKAVLANNPSARVITNTAVGKILAAENIAFEIIEGTAAGMIGEIAIEARDGKHEEIYGDMGQVQNTGYLIAEKLFYPGDAYTAPGVPVDILALPVAGPWCKIPEAIRYALKIKPRVAFPVHDAMLQKERVGSAYFAPQKVLPENGIEFTPIADGESRDF
ncbi:MAG: MBL fold metallo-hydrolase [Candidatus Kaiserbacteria bacterium]|nr:MBL fold metallo-hydrolase [Candidatus Kaiserbacteria bacterium]